MKTPMRTALVPPRYEEPHMYGTGYTDVRQPGVQDRDRTLSNQCRRQINELVPAETITTTIRLSYEKKSSSQRANEELFDSIISSWLSLWKRHDDVMEKGSIINEVRLSGLKSISERLRHLDELAEEDPEQTPMDVESLRWFAGFVMEEYLPPPKIGLKPDGLVQAVWFVQDGILSMDFLPSGDIRYIAILQNGEWSANGISPPDRIMKEIEPFERALDR